MNFSWGQNRMGDKKSWLYDNDRLGSKRNIGKAIIDLFDKRQIEPTPNNKNSSRSHMVIVVFFQKMALVLAFFFCIQYSPCFRPIFFQPSLLKKEVRLFLSRGETQT